MAYATIVATGSYLPPIEVSNDILRARFEATAPEFVDKMEAASGIRSRWYAPEEWSASDLALRASQQALERAGKTAEEVDLIILGTDCRTTSRPPRPSCCRPNWARRMPARSTS